jgi:uroporphyrinogen decarboxylase
MGTTEFMMATAMHPEETHKLLRIITDFTIDWLQYQKEIFPDVDGIFILDDIVGFVGDMECNEYVIPYLSEIFKAFDASVRFFHNDASGLISSKYLRQIGVNLFNFSHDHSFDEIFELTGNDIILLGNLPPRDVLASGSTKDVENGVQAMVESVEDTKKVIWSCGGGMPPNVPVENIHTFYNTVVNLL